MTENKLDGRQLVPAVWESNDRSDASQRALQYQSWLAESLERDHDEVFLKTSKSEAIPRELIRAASVGVQETDPYLWSSELLQCAVKDQSSYAEQSVEADDLPNNLQLWLAFGGGSAETMRMESERFSVGARLVLPFPDQHLVVYLKVLHPLSGLSVDLHAVPTLALCGMLHAGEPVDCNKGGEVFSCLRYLEETIEAERDVALLTKAPRKGHKAPSEEAGVRISMLRKMVFPPSAGSERASRHYEFRYSVRSFVRKPSPLMHNPRPVVVKAHTRGPADKPLKERTPTVYVVTR